MVNETIPVLIDHVKRLLELLDLILVKHGKDIGSGPLGPLLGPRPSGGFSTRHFGCCKGGLFKEPGSSRGQRATHALSQPNNRLGFKSCLFKSPPQT